MLARRILLIGSFVLVGFSGGERAAHAGWINQAMRWTGWGCSDGYHARTQGWVQESSAEWEETVPTPEAAPSEPKPAAAPRTSWIPRNLLAR